MPDQQKYKGSVCYFNLNCVLKPKIIQHFAVKIILFNEQDIMFSLQHCKIPIISVSMVIYFKGDLTFFHHKINNNMSSIIKERYLKLHWWVVNL